MSPLRLPYIKETVHSEAEFFAALSAAIGGEIDVKKMPSHSALGFTIHEYILTISFNGKRVYGNVMALEPSGSGDGYFRYRGATRDSDLMEIKIKWKPRAKRFT